MEHVVDGLGDGVVLRHPGALSPHPVVQVIDHRAHQPLACVTSCHGAQAVDLALGFEDAVHAFDRVQRDGRDLLGDLFALARCSLDVSQFEELAPGMRPAERALHRRGLVTVTIEAVVATIGISLQDARPARQVPGRMFHPAVGREVIERRRWRPACKGPVVAQIGPEPRGLRAALGHQRHGRVVGVQSFSTENMGADQIVEGLQRHGTGPDLVGQC